MKLTNKELKEYLNAFEEDAVVCIIPVTLEDKKVYKPQEILMMEAEEMDSPSLVVRLGRARNMDAEERCIIDGCEMEEQPELPKLKNNDQRKEFLKTYRDWPVWFEVPQAEEIYYRYILPDGSAIVICEYKKRNDWWANKYIDKDPETTGTVEYLLEPGYGHLHDCSTNETALIRKLMEVQKNEDNKNK